MDKEINDWIETSDKLPPHMDELKVWIERKAGGYERERKAVYLAFDGNFYDAEEQETLHNVKKWKLI
jgi:hypothetical protein